MGNWNYNNTNLDTGYFDVIKADGTVMGTLVLSTDTNGNLNTSATWVTQGASTSVNLTWVPLSAALTWTVGGTLYNLTCGQASPTIFSNAQYTMTFNKHDGNYSVSVPVFSVLNGGTLHVETKIPANCYFQLPNNGTKYSFTPTNPGHDLNFSIPGPYNFTGAYTAGGNGQSPKYSGQVDDGRPSPTETNGSWTATQTNPMPIPEEERPHQAHKKAV